MITGSEETLNAFTSMPCTLSRSSQTRPSSGTSLSGNPALIARSRTCAYIMLARNEAKPSLPSGHHLLIEVEFIRLLRSLNLTRICVLQVTLDDVVPVLPHGAQTRLLHDRRNNGTR